MLTSGWIGVGGDGHDILVQNKDPISNSVAEGKDSEKTKKTVLSKKVVPPSGVDIAPEAPRDKKRKSEGSKEKSPSTKKKRSSKAGEPGTVRNDTPQDGLGKVKNLKLSNRQEIGVRQDQIEVSSTSFEGHVTQECSHGGEERASVKVAKKESDFDITSAGTYSASHGGICECTLKAISALAWPWTSRHVDMTCFVELSQKFLKLIYFVRLILICRSRHRARSSD